MADSCHIHGFSGMRHGLFGPECMTCLLDTTPEPRSPVNFVKHDAEKVRYSLMDHQFEHEIAEVLTNGAKVYTDENWKQATPAEAKARYYSALRRHLKAYLDGQELDPDSGLPHLAHAGCCLMFMRFFERMANASPSGNPDRP